MIEKKVEGVVQRYPNNKDHKAALDLARAEVEEFSKLDAEGAFCRSRLEWQVEGERPSKLFCNLEKFNAVQKYIPELKVTKENGEQHHIKDQRLIKQRIKCAVSKDITLKIRDLSTKSKVPLTTTQI